MATKSILKSIHVTNKQLAKGLANALENAEGKPSKEVALRRKIEEVRGSDIRKFFEGK